MASLQARTKNGQKYWSIVESRRVNGKPRPVIIAYLGKAETLLKRLQGITEAITLKSYSHGCVAAMLRIADELDICPLINAYILNPKSTVAAQPLRNHLTAGASCLLAAIGRTCRPTSKRGWREWAKKTSLGYLLRINLEKLDSQHFWDHMDALPISAIEKIEQHLLKQVFEKYKLETDSLFFDTTNFFTYIHSTNDNCELPKRGRNKQKRNDLRQIGLAMVVSRKDLLPLFHLPYEGNMNDTKVFSTVLDKLQERLTYLEFPIAKHTLIFDRGNNSKENLNKLVETGFYYVGALTPYQHKGLVEEAAKQFVLEQIGEKELSLHRTKKEIWGQERTIVVYISERLKQGQLRGIYQSVDKIKKSLAALQESIQKPRAKKYTQDELEQKIKGLIKGQFMDDTFHWELESDEPGRFKLNYSINKTAIGAKEDSLGFRILMTNHHDWSNAEIINAYHGQAAIEKAFKEIKNPFHMAVRPQFHWTDQKIRVHYFICVLGYLLITLLWLEAKQALSIHYSLNTFINHLNNIRLGSMLASSSNKRGKPKVIYKLEATSDEEQELIDALCIGNLHNKRPKLHGVGVYK